VASIGFGEFTRYLIWNVKRDEMKSSSRNWLREESELDLDLHICE
jgi:hypothetical protein